MMPRRSRRTALLGWTVALAAGVLNSGCSDSLPSLPKMGELNPFKETVPPLPGKRIAVLPAQDNTVGELAEASGPIVLPSPQLNDTWPQPGGSPSNAPGHLALSGNTLKQSWSASAGKGTNKVGRVSAPPIVYEGRVFALDSDGKVTAFSVSGGSALWTATLAPTTTKTGPGFSAITQNILNLTAEDGGGYGGGLAADGGRIYAVSGFGAVIALDPATGKRLWEKDIGVPIRAAPTTAGDRIFALTIEGKLYCLSTTDGTELWVVRGASTAAARSSMTAGFFSSTVSDSAAATSTVSALRRLGAAISAMEALVAPPPSERVLEGCSAASSRSGATSAFLTRAGLAGAGAAAVVSPQRATSSGARFQV